MFPSSSPATDGHVGNVAANVEVRLSIRLVDDAAGRAHVIIRDRVDHVGQRETRRTAALAD